MNNVAWFVVLAGLVLGCGSEPARESRVAAAPVEAPQEEQPPAGPAAGGPLHADATGAHPVAVNPRTVRPLPPEEADAGVELHAIDGRAHRVASRNHDYLSIARARTRIQRHYVSEQNIALRGGRTAARGDWPWAVALLNEAGGAQFLNCGGALIAPQWVLTAAHCDVDGQDEAIVGSTDLADRSQGTRTGIEKICVHPQFDSTLMDWDVALVKLETSLTTKQMERTPGDPQWELDGTRALTIGWGKIDPAGNYKSTLQEISLPLVSNGVCSTAFPNAAYSTSVTPQMLCVSGGGNRGSCDGDSGGPLMVQHSAMRRWLGIGIVSWGSACDPGAPYGVYGRVSQFNRWIDQAIGGNPQCKSSD